MLKREDAKLLILQLIIARISQGGDDQAARRRNGARSTTVGIRRLGGLLALMVANLTLGQADALGIGSSIRSRGVSSRKMLAEKTSRADDVQQTDLAQAWFLTLTGFVATWPSRLTEELIDHASIEQQFLQGSEILASELADRRIRTLECLTSQLPSVPFRWQNLDDSATGSLESEILSLKLELTRGLRQPMLVNLHNDTDTVLRLQPYVRFPESEPVKLSEGLTIPARQTLPVVLDLSVPAVLDSSGSLELSFRSPGETPQIRNLKVPFRAVEPAVLRVDSVNERGHTAPSRITVDCSDGISRYAGRLASSTTFSDKPIIFPPLGTWKKLPFFYVDRSFEIRVPPGKTTIAAGRGFEYSRDRRQIEVSAGQTYQLQLNCKPLIDMPAKGWISGDTHVHWVTNAWNVDQPLQDLQLVQRAEDVKVINNLTLLQRYADQAFIKPSQAPMGAIQELSDSQYHVQMGEEYRNENLYGHLCFLNIDWIVPPLGTGSIIAGPDALDYPINRSAIQACRDQGGISIEAHGTGGNKDVPVNIIHDLSDSLDQMEPEMYYRLLDCGFRLPLTNGSDHPARPLGSARAYVKIDGDFSYDAWIQGIRRGRTFTTSGPLLFLTVNQASIGDVIETSADALLEITASVVSSEAIGRLQIVSNGQVVCDDHFEENQGELKFTMPAGQSRWIVARCSNRTNGRAEFGFGDFNPITGSGVAHTSPIYVQIDGTPRYEENATRFWAERMHLHAAEILANGRFANDDQRDQAVGYILQGIQMYQQLPQQVKLARSRFETFEERRSRMINVVRRLGFNVKAEEALERMENCQSDDQLQQALAPLTLVEVSINPESRTKISSRVQRISLKAGRPERFLVLIENTAGITAPLRIQSVDLAMDPPRTAAWCQSRLIDSPFSSKYCTGANREYKVMELLVDGSGMREVRLVADVGQGTQDLGFRATTDLQLIVE